MKFLQAGSSGTLTVILLGFNEKEAYYAANRVPLKKAVTFSREDLAIYYGPGDPPLRHEVFWSVS